LYRQLASSGYIVAAIDHTYQSPYSNFPDGRTVVISPIFLEEVQRDSLAALGDPEEDNRILQNWLSIRLADLRFVTDRLKEVNQGAPSGPLAGRIDGEHIGYIGHSLGGSAVALFCRAEERCKAAISLDGPMYGDRTSIDATGQQVILENPFPRPLMLMHGMLYADPKYRDTVYLADQRAFEHATQPIFMLLVRGAGHMNFTDLPLVSPILAQVQGTGTIDAGRCLVLVNRYAQAFFDLYLKDEPSSLMDGPSPEYPEVMFESRNQ
jgi:hypothetical protein